jgi:glycosyltransferase involved in cell wall biosynthesis
MEVPSVSVIIPSYNRASLIGETLECMLRQSLPPHEILVIDDGSTDGSLQVIKTFGGRVRVLCQPNSGPAVARNRGLDQATGDYVQFFDSDDLCTLNKLEAQVNALIQSGADFAYGPWLKARLDRKNAMYDERVLQQRGLPEQRSALTYFLRGWVIVFQCCMFRRSFLTKVGRYRSDLMPSEDSEFLFRMLKAGGRGVHVPDALVLYRVHEQGQISAGGTARTKRVIDWAHYAETVMRQLDGPGEPVSVLDILRWRAVVYAARKDLMALPSQTITGHSSEVQFGSVEALLHRLLKRAGQVRAGLRQRTSGTRFPSFFQLGALTESQKELIRQLGYKALDTRDMYAVAEGSETL